MQGTVEVTETVRLVEVTDAEPLVNEWPPSHHPVASRNIPRREGARRVPNRDRSGGLATVARIAAATPGLEVRVERHDELPGVLWRRPG